MPSSILNSDDGVISGTAGLKNSGGDDAVLLIQTKGVTAQTVDAGQRTMFPTTIGVGGATPSTSGSGISFPATQSASSNANTLDDYEEGTFTPSLTFGSGSVIYSEQSGSYTKIGRLVNCTIAFEISSVASPSGSVGISGLPFSNGSGERFVSGASIGVLRNMVTSNAFIRAFVNSGGTVLSVQANANNAGSSALQGGEIQANTLFYLSVTFNTA